MDSLKRNNYLKSKKCADCGKEITDVSFRCFKCAMGIRKTNILKTCPECNKQFRIFKSDEKYGMGKYCSKECSYSAKKKFVFTEKHRLKISKALKGRVSPTLGYKFPKQAILKSGENNPNWNGGKSFEPYSSEFNRILKLRIRERDSFKCRLCGSDGKNFGRSLDIHHIDYDKKNVNDDNLISLCVSCHMKTNYKRESWRKYFNG